MFAKDGSTVSIACQDFGLSTTVAPDGSNYKAVKNLGMAGSMTVTFVMTDNKLTSIEANHFNGAAGTNNSYTFTVPTN